MSEPLSWQLVEAIAQRLRGIAADDGYYTDLGADVRAEGYALEELQGDISLRAYVYATSLTRDTGASGQRTKKDAVALSIDVMVPTGVATAQRAAHRALADVRRVLDTPAREWLPAGLGAPQIETQLIESRPGGLRLIVVQFGLTALITEVQDRT